MAGVPAARLSIEIFAEIARLQQDLDSAKRLVASATGAMGASAKAANDNLAGLGKGAGAGIAEFSREVARLKGQMDPAWASLQRYRDQLALLRQALREGAITHKQFVSEVQGAAAAYKNSGQQVATAAGAQRAGMQQLSMQLNDVATQFAMGTPPMQIFAQQSGQVVQAVQLMNGGTSKLGAFLMGPWGMAVVAATVVLIPFISKLFETKAAANSAEGALQSLIDKRRQEVAERNLLAKSEEGLNEQLERQAELQAILASRPRDSQGRITHSYREQKELAALEKSIAEGRAAIADETARRSEKDVQGIQQMIDARAKLAGATTSADRAQAQYTIRILEAQTAFDKSSKGEQDQQRLLAARTAAERDLNLAQDANRERRRQGLSEEQKAYKQSYEAAQSFIENLELETAKIGLNEKAIRSLELARAKDAAATEGQRQRIEQLGRAREDALALEKGSSFAKELAEETAALGANAVELKERTAVAAASALVDAALGASTEEMRDRLLEQSRAISDNLVKWKERRAEMAQQDFDKLIQGLKDERSLRGLVGAARAEAALELEKEGFIADWTARGLKNAAEAWGEYYSERLRDISEESALDTDRKRAELLADELYRVVDAISALGGAGSTLGGLLGFLSGDIGGIRGPIGDLLNTVIGTRDVIDPQTGKKTGEIIAETIGSEMRKVLGDFGRDFGEVLKGAGMGMLAGSAIFGKQGAVGQLSSAVGGALGQEAGKSFLTFLGGAAGPIGSIAGGIIGAVAGKLLSGVLGGRSAGAVVTGSGVSNFGGSKGNYGAANDLAGSVTDSLAKMADALGATVGDFRVTIGMFKDEIRVNTSGGNTLKGSGVRGFGQDAEAAVKFALSEIIRAGALEGLRAGTQALLTKGGDVEAQLEKALAFEGVFKALEESADPAAAALAQLEKEFAALKSIFDEAGASAEERAKLEELYQRRRTEVDQGVGVDDGGLLEKKRALEIELMTAQGDIMGALAATRAQELAQLDPSLHALQNQVWAEQELAAQREKAAQEARNIAALQIELLQAQGRETEAIALQRRQQLAGMTAAEAALQKQIWTAQEAVGRSGPGTGAGRAGSIRRSGRSAAPVPRDPPDAGRGQRVRGAQCTARGRAGCSADGRREGVAQADLRSRRCSAPSCGSGQSRQ
jgi:hypothetical protein